MSTATSISPPRSDLEHALGVIEFFFEPGDVIELRALEVRRSPEAYGATFAGYFNVENVKAVYAAIESVYDRADGIYFVLNPVAPELLARSCNHLRRGLKNTTKDADIVKRRWFVIDVDPDRRSGIGSTDAQHVAALERAKAIREYLATLGWPTPLYADSGNGAHLVYRVELENNEETTGLLKACLAALARFDDAAAKVDQTTFNAARIWKLYGTVARKGDDMPDRPHRVSRALEGPGEHIEAVPLDLLRNLAAEAPTAKRETASSRMASFHRGQFDIDAWIASSGLAVVRGPDPYAGGRRWTLDHCPFNPSHAKPVIFELAGGALVYKCLHQSCKENDWHALRRLVDPSYRDQGAARDAVPGTPPPAPDDWRTGLLRYDSGSPKRLLANAITALRCAPQWEGVLAFNEFSLTVCTLKLTPWGDKEVLKWTDQEDRLAADWLQHHGIEVSVSVADEAVQAVARDRSFHPVRDYLSSLSWDGKKRIDSWLKTYLGAKKSKYSSAVGARWLISAVARVYRPGAKVDTCLILEGPQGLRKSTAVRTLAGPWFADEISELGSKDAALQLPGVWIIELAELDALNRSDVARIKSFMSRQQDHFRPPYGRHAIDVPRQCVFAGTVNKPTYLQDDTGGRRFWPVTCGAAIKIDALTRDRDQLWAEARERFEAGEHWWLDTLDLNRAAETEQEDRYEQDAWHPLIEKFVEHEDFVTVQGVLETCIRKLKENWTQTDANRVARCLRALNWKRVQERVDPTDEIARNVVES